MTDDEQDDYSSIAMDEVAIILNNLRHEIIAKYDQLEADYNSYTADCFSEMIDDAFKDFEV